MLCDLSACALLAMRFSARVARPVAMSGNGVRVCVISNKLMVIYNNIIVVFEIDG